MTETKPGTGRSATTYQGWYFTEGRDVDEDGVRIRKHERLPKDVKLDMDSSYLSASKSALDALSYAPGPWLRRVELRGEMLIDEDRAFARERVTLAGPVDVSRELRIFACDCGERVLPLFEAKHPGDDRPRRAIEVARRFADGDATMAEMQDAQYAAWAAWASWAAWAAWDAAGYAGYAAGNAAGEAAQYAAQSAARDTGYVSWAARAAVLVAVQTTEREWQESRLTELLSQVLGLPGVDVDPEPAGIEVGL
jgi:hypothetical protein